MKLITLTLIYIILSSAAYAQEIDKAPFGGKLIDQSDLMIIERSDGSQFMCINGQKWILFKKSLSNNPLPIPENIKNSKISETVYTSLSGQEYISYDGYHWLKMKETYNATKVESTNDAGLIKVTKAPVNPANKNFSIGLYIAENVQLQFSIVDLQGNIIIEETINLAKGFHNINRDISKISSGTYIYKISASYDFVSNVFIVSR